jgi:hypothetical protein
VKETLLLLKDHLASKRKEHSMALAISHWAYLHIVANKLATL